MGSIAEKQRSGKPLAKIEKRTQAIVEALELLTESGQVIELRIPNAQRRGNRTDAGYFDNAQELAKVAATQGGGECGGICHPEPSKPGATGPICQPNRAIR